MGYDSPWSNGPDGSPHPLRGVPQASLDAAARLLEDALGYPPDGDSLGPSLDDLSRGDVEAVAHNVLAAGTAPQRLAAARVLVDLERALWHAEDHEGSTRYKKAQGRLSGACRVWEALTGLTLEDAHKIADVAS
jgi:hypothetical protein